MEFIEVGETNHDQHGKEIADALNTINLINHRFLINLDLI